MCIRDSAMNEIGVTGITITNVLGCGIQKGSTTYYRGVEMDMNLLPKVKIEIVVSLVPVQKVIDTAKTILHTGQIGDGKVFIYDIENVVKIVQERKVSWHFRTLHLRSKI